jgi:hypothetical protein
MANNQKKIAYCYTPPKSIAVCIDNNIRLLARKDYSNINNVITKALKTHFCNSKEEGLCEI